MPQAKTPPHSKPEAPVDANHREAALDEALDESFPASDPVAISVDHEPAPEPKPRNDHDSHGKRTR
ncbi:hypothetical protein [Caballeronia sp. dw_19]|jgi:hypothetical protein|uniref:hypothetical protein n=1 Tax=unclassified Caballeronia TaxID=2646786 RepID=UPI001BD26275|nr:hypothetical protein [Caballeronia sp. dw_19]